MTDSPVHSSLTDSPCGSTVPGSVPAAGPREQQETQQLPYATVLTLEAVFTGKLVLTELQVSHCWGWHGSTDLPISTGLRAQEGWEWSRRGEGRSETGWGGGGRMDEADLATVMEWDFEWEVLVGEGVEGEGCDHTETGWSKAIRDLLFFFPAAVWKGLRSELSPQGGGELT